MNWIRENTSEGLKIFQDIIVQNVEKNFKELVVNNPAGFSLFFIKFHPT